MDMAYDRSFWSTLNSGPGSPKTLLPMPPLLLTWAYGRSCVEKIKEWEALCSQHVQSEDEHHRACLAIAAALMAGSGNEGGTVVPADAVARLDASRSQLAHIHERMRRFLAKQGVAPNAPRDEEDTAPDVFRSTYAPMEEERAESSAAGSPAG
jgi:hypothetical protein